MNIIEEKDEAISILNEAKEKIEEASYQMEEVMRIVDNLDTGYNMSGNMRVYVINYLTGGIDSITDKIEAYIEQLNQLKPEDCEFYSDGDCIYEEDCGEYASKCADIQVIGKCQLIKR